MHIKNIVGKEYVLDSSAFINAFSVDFENALTTPGVVGEVKDLASRGLLEAARSKGLRIVSPSRDSVERVRGKASRLLSRVDVEVLALAFERKAVVVTDDYRMQNTAKKLGLEFISIVRGSMKRA